MSGNYAYSAQSPSEMAADTLRDLGHEKSPLLRVIRAKCLECCCDQPSEVRRCHIADCALWPYRMGKNPFSGRKGNPGNFS